MGRHSICVLRLLLVDPRALVGGIHCAQRNGIRRTVVLSPALVDRDESSTPSTSIVVVEAVRNLGSAVGCRLYRLKA